jgi:hypothetical protein
LPIGLLNYDLNKILSFFSHAKSHIGDDVSAGHPFLAIAWCCVTSQLFAVIMMYILCRRRWKYQKNLNAQTRDTGEEQRPESLNYERDRSVGRETIMEQNLERTSEETAPPSYETAGPGGDH